MTAAVCSYEHFIQEKRNNQRISRERESRHQQMNRGCRDGESRTRTRTRARAPVLITSSNKGRERERREREIVTKKGLNLSLIGGERFQYARYSKTLRFKHPRADGHATLTMTFGTDEYCRPSELNAARDPLRKME